MKLAQLYSSLNILWHCPSLGLEWKLIFSSPMATAEFSKFSGILSTSLSQHHLFSQLSTVQSLSHVRLFVTVWTLALQTLLSIVFSGKEYWSGYPFPSPGDHPTLGIKPRSPTLQADFFTVWATREVPNYWTIVLISHASKVVLKIF